MPAKNDTRDNHDKQWTNHVGEPKGDIDWEARCRFLAGRDAIRAKELLRAHAAMKAAQKDAAEQRRLRLEAEANARAFHALLLQERIRKL